MLGYSTEKDDKAKLDRATIANNTAQYLILIGQYAEAERIGRSAVAARGEMQGREHLDTLTSMSNLTGVLNRQGKYEETEAKNAQTLAGCLGLAFRHADDCLAHLLTHQRRYDESLALYKRPCIGYQREALSYRF
jgi:ABC-type tungstate transport system permease subunit